jgi:hypothetical protein
MISCKFFRAIYLFAGRALLKMLMYSPSLRYLQVDDCPGLQSMLPSSAAPLHAHTFPDSAANMTAEAAEAALVFSDRLERVCDTFQEVLQTRIHQQQMQYTWFQLELRKKEFSAVTADARLCEMATERFINSTLDMIKREDVERYCTATFQILSAPALRDWQVKQGFLMFARVRCVDRCC